jgi:hypothetical protein
MPRVQLIVAGITDFVVKLRDQEAFEVTSGPREALRFDRAHRTELADITDRERLFELAFYASQRDGKVPDDWTFEDFVDQVEDLSFLIGEEELDDEGEATGSSASEPGEPASDEKPAAAPASRRAGTRSRAK